MIADTSKKIVADVERMIATHIDEIAALIEGSDLTPAEVGFELRNVAFEWRKRADQLEASA